MSDQPLRNSAVGLGRNGAGSFQFEACATQRAGEVQHRRSIAPWDAGPPEDTGDKMERRRQLGTLQDRSSPCAIDIWHRERRLHPHAIRRADPLEELERGSITAEENVLSVIYQLAGFSVAKGGCPAAELRPRVSDEDTSSLCRKCGGRAKAGKSSAYDDDKT